MKLLRYISVYPYASIDRLIYTKYFIIICYPLICRQLLYTLIIATILIFHIQAQEKK